MPQTSVVMTVIGADRPGLVGELSATIAGHGGNWLESRMAHLGGQFAGILRIQVSVDREQELLASLRALATQGLAVHVQRDASPPPPADQALVTVEVIGHDRPGIVREISQVFAHRQVNVEELTTDCDSAPMSGERLFRATARVRLPAGFPLAELRHALEHIASDLMVDIAVKPETGA